MKYGESTDGSEDVKLAGAVMGLFTPDTEEFTEENALLTVTTGEDGSFAFENIPYGHWIVKEISAPALYTVSPEEHHIYIGVDGQTIEIRVDDTLIRGRVQLHKTEAVDEPSSVESDKENTFLRFLSGAVFELYEDTNSNKELDAEDTLVGTLKETDGGFHMAENLLAKGYFVKEKKAPEGYQPDEKAYYFAITEDGQTVVIENGEAGRGFTNEAYRGNLKITKDSSDGRKDGFAIEVKSADGSYCETFTTPKSGVIEVKGPCALAFIP
ncbi:MAG: collagen binding domain-containing protein [Lachnospiraceae bacterium]